MKKLFKLFLLLSLCVNAFGQSNSIAIIPEPVSMTANAGHFILPKNISVEAPNKPGLKETILLLTEKLKNVTGAQVKVTSASAATNTIRLILNKTANATIGKEGYELNVTATGVLIKANEPAGLFYGIQTFWQLLPKEIEGNILASHVKWEAPCVSITDYPRFGWRGLMFDVARHFFTKAQVKQYIDAMVKYKFNLLHLHLTDDEGWRIEIKSLPNLTKVGAYNVKKVGYFGTFSTPTPDEPRDYGGFYTQDDIRELVQYAKERFVNILPEIDVPGHSLA
ncbi:MAG TPA: family 20 glycosylhydrolase, partial [Puia sp.]|nr:family 20 glycosylhydrolase [Puia sp.]